MSSTIDEEIQRAARTVVAWRLSGEYRNDKHGYPYFDNAHRLRDAVERAVEKVLLDRVPEAFGAAHDVQRRIAAALAARLVAKDGASLSEIIDDAEAATIASIRARLVDMCAAGLMEAKQ